MSMQQVAEGQANPEIVINRNSQTLEHQAVYGQRQSAHSGLTYGYYGGRWGGNAVSDGTLTLSASSTNHVVVARATGVISTSTASTNWDNTTDYARVYKLTTSASAVTATEDHRAGPYGVHGQTSPSPGGSGDVSGPGSSTDNSIPRFDGTGGKTLQGSGVLVSDSDEISGYKGQLNTQTGTTYTIVAGDSGKVIDHANGAAITVTLPNSLAVGFCCTYVQSGAGQVSFSAASGATIRNRQSHTKIAGQYGAVTLVVRTNSGGSAAEYVLCGDTAA